MGMNYYAVSTKPTTNPPLHIGKSSYGHRFNFHEVSSAWENPFEDIAIYTFPQWEDFLTRSINEGRIVILNEEDEEVSLEDFLNLVERKQLEGIEDDFVYSKNIDGYRFMEGEFS